MKFGKEFKKQKVPEWTETYMDYNGLKRILQEINHFKQSKQPSTPLRALHLRSTRYKAFTGLNQQTNDFQTSRDLEEQVIAVNTVKREEDSRNLYNTNFLMSPKDEGRENEVKFFKKLDDELNKVNTFYKDKVEEVMKEAAQLNKQMDTLIALRIKVENPDSNCDSNFKEGTSSSVGKEEVNADKCKPAPLKVLDHVKINNTLESPRSTIKGILNDSKEEDLSFNKEELRKVEERLRHVLIEFYQKLRLLKHYSFMNLSAFSKIMKKYEKITSRRAARSYMKVVDSSYLGSCDEVNGLMEGVEVTFIKYFSNSNRRAGMKLLRPKHKREKHSITFFSGFFAGCSIALLVGVVLLIQTRKETDSMFMESIFPLYSLYAYIILHMLLYSANIYFWKLYRVNYPFIFGFKQGTELSYRETFLLSTGFAVLALTTFLIHLHIKMELRDKAYDSYIELIPLGLLIVILVIMFCPFRIIYSSSRFFLLQTMFRCICAPLYTVSLPDFFLADQLTSQIQAIRSFEFYICYYGWGLRSQTRNKCHNSDIYNNFYIIVAVIPYWIRCLQCLRRLFEDRDMVHSYNGLRYFLTIVAVVIRTCFELRKGSTWKVLTLVSSIIATMFNTYWDIIVDWGLLQRKSKNLFLRDKLLVSHRSVYFAAMVLDIILRFAWLQVVLKFDMRYLRGPAVSTLFACLEIIRRGMWNFFRLENEHLNNVGKYRAFKSVPLPFNYYNDENSEKDE